MPRRDLALPEVGQQLRALLRARLLGEGAPQPGARPRAARRAAPHRLRPSGGSRRAAHRRSGRSAADARDALGRRALLRQRRGRGGVPRPALARPEVLVERGADDRVDEAEVHAAREDVGADQVVGRRVGRIGPRPETRAASRSSQSSPSTATVLASSLADGPSAASRCRTKRLTAAGPTAWTSFAAAAEGLDPGGAQRGQQLADEERVAARRGVARAAELLRRAVAELLARQPRHGRLAQRLRVQRDRRRARRDLRPQRARAVLGGVRRAAGEEQRDRQVLDPLREVGQEPQRFAIGPLAVVDGSSSGPWSTRFTTSQ